MPPGMRSVPGGDVHSVVCDLRDGCLSFQRLRPRLVFRPVRRLSDLVFDLYFVSNLYLAFTVV